MNDKRLTVFLCLILMSSATVGFATIAHFNQMTKIATGNVSAARVSGDLMKMTEGNTPNLGLYQTQCGVTPGNGCGLSYYATMVDQNWQLIDAKCYSANNPPPSGDGGGGGGGGYGVIDESSFFYDAADLGFDPQCYGTYPSTYTYSGKILPSGHSLTITQASIQIISNAANFDAGIWMIASDGTDVCECEVGFTDATNGFRTFGATCATDAGTGCKFTGPQTITFQTCASNTIHCNLINFATMTLDGTGT